jgi:dTMP kinase
LTRGHFVALEGIEASGKSTQASRLASAVGAVMTREPGGTPLGRTLRSLLLDAGSAGLDARAEALLMAADRTMHIRDVVRPALESGRHVVSDRSAMSLLAYQGFGRGLDVEELRRLSDWASFGLWPELVVLIDVPPDAALIRLDASGAGRDRFEGEDRSFHQRVHAGYRTLAAADPERWVIVDGTGPVSQVAERVLSAWNGRFG